MNTLTILVVNGLADPALAHSGCIIDLAGHNNWLVAAKEETNSELQEA